MRRAAIAVLLVWAGAARADDRSGVRPEVLNLPQGPGSIEGLGTGFEPNAQTGTASFTVAIAVPPGTGGFTPQLALRYSSGSGNGPLGVGWSLPLPVVERSTDRRLPHDDTSDAFALRNLGGAGNEELVQLPDGSYRFRIEGAFVRGTVIDGQGWEFRSPSGRRYRFGEATRTFSWQLVREEDPFGNPIDYQYEHDATGRPYLSRVVWNDFSPQVRNEILLLWEDRPDVLTSYLPGFAMVTARRLARIVVAHGGAPIRTYELTYQMTMGLSRLASIRLVGRDGTTALPPLTMSYAEPRLEAAAVTTMTAAPARSLDHAELDDVDGDGLADLLVMDPALDGGRYSYYPNLDGTQFGPRQLLAASPSLWMGPGVELADFDGDGAADVVARLSADSVRYYPSAAGGFGAGVATTPFQLGDPDVKLVDLDHDRRVDWLRIDPTTGQMSAAFNLGGGRFGDPVALGRLDPDEVLAFSRGLQLADMNGDGLVDLVAVRSGSVRYWPSMGLGRFAPAVSLPGAPGLDATELAQLLVQDLDGDGLADLVHVGASQVRIWRNQAGTSLGAVTTITGTPAWSPTTVVRLADVNGNGSRDIVWIDPASATPWRYLDVLGGGGPGLLTHIDNGLGKTTDVTYAGLGEMRDWARANGVAWTRRSALGQMVVARIDLDDGLGEHTQTELRYADAYFDGPTREFRGFGRVLSIAHGDATQPTLVTDTTFDVGDAEEARKGLALTVTRRSEGGATFDQVQTDYLVRTLDGGTRFAFAHTQTTLVYELGDSARTLRRDWDRDDYGNIIHEAQTDDATNQMLVERSFHIDPAAWIVDRPSDEIVRAADGARLSQRHIDYDDHGAPSQVSTWIDGDRFGLVERLERDDHGNVRARTDGRGARTELDYDAESQTLVTSVRKEGLEWHADYDRALAVITRLRGPDGSEHRCQYDALGRPVALVEPGDSDALPTRRFEYHPGSPLSYVRAEQRTTSGDPAVEVTISYSDGLGRARGTFARAEGGRWAASGLVRFGARGAIVFAAQPRFVDSADWLPADGAGETTESDALGRTTRIVHADGAARITSYAPWQTELHDENGHIQRQHSDGLGRLRERIELDGAREISTHYDYDARGKLVSVVDALGQMRRYEWDGRGRQVAVIDPSAGRWTLAYDDADGLLQRTDATGAVVRFDLDRLGRPLVEWHGAEAAVRYEYDGAGRLGRVHDEAGEVRFQYDARGRVTDRVRRFGNREYATWTDYDAADRPIRRGFPDGTYVPIRYDERGLPAQLGGIVTAATWTAWGGWDSVQFGNGAVDRREYDARLRVTRMDAGALRDLRYQFDAASLIRSIQDGRSQRAIDQSADYDYDDRNRLVRAGATSWQYDDLARIVRVQGELDHSYTYDGDRLARFDGETFQYDDAGRVVADGSRKLFWDAKGRLARVERGEVVEEYVYGYDDARAVKTTRQGGHTIITRYIDADAEERDGRLERYVMLAGKRIARLPAEPPSDALSVPPDLPRWLITATLLACLLSRLRRPRFRWAGAIALALAGCGGPSGHTGTPIDHWPAHAELYLGDHLDSIVAVADARGNLVAETTYHPYGQVRATSGPQDPRGYVANEIDGTGLSDFHARPYRADAAVFLAPEPVALIPRRIGDSSLPLYAYSVGNPIALSDRSGMDPEYTVVARSFAPWLTFGGAGMGSGAYVGDNRGFTTSTAESVRAKIHLYTSIDLSAAPKAQAWCSQSVGIGMYPTFMAWFSGKGQREGNLVYGTAIAHKDVFGARVGDMYILAEHAWAAMPLATGAPDIDLHLALSFKLEPGGLHITGGMAGDQFPNAEAFIRDPAGHSVFLTTYQAHDREFGPYRFLAGDRGLPMGEVDMKLGLDDHGNFTNVQARGKTWTLDQWNAQFEGKGRP